MAVKGSKVSGILKSVLRDLVKLKSPLSVQLSKANNTRPFEDRSTIEFLSDKNDCSLFAFASHTKKRPHNLVLGRLFNFQVLDMFEFAVDQKSFVDMQHFRVSKNSLSFSGNPHRLFANLQRKTLARLGQKPMMMFQGEEWQSVDNCSSLRSLLMDMYRGQEMDKINLASLDRVMICTILTTQQHKALLANEQPTSTTGVSTSSVDESATAAVEEESQEDDEDDETVDASENDVDDSDDDMPQAPKKKTPSPASTSSSSSYVVVIRQYCVEFRKSGSRTPRVELVELGPRMDLHLRRTFAADEALRKEASVNLDIGIHWKSSHFSVQLQGCQGRRCQDG